MRKKKLEPWDLSDDVLTELDERLSDLIGELRLMASSLSEMEILICLRNNALPLRDKVNKDEWECIEEWLLSITMNTIRYGERLAKASLNSSS